MSKLIQHINMDIPNFPKEGIYCYGEASFESNQAMQEPLEKLYKYENQPDMREKVKEYISELDVEIDRCNKFAEQNIGLLNPIPEQMMLGRARILTEVKNDLQSRLNELI